MIRLWPRSLTGQLALLIALTLFAAQAIDFALLLRQRAEFRLAQATRPVATRIADALERGQRGDRPLEADRGRVRRVASNPIPPIILERHPEVAVELRRQLAELGLTVGRIDTGLNHKSDEDAPPWLRERGERPGASLLIAVEQPGRGWLKVVAPWPQPGPRLLLALLSQTLILYAVVLLPMLWAVRHIARPLRDLTRAAEAFAPGDIANPVPERGPVDVARLIAAFNALRLRVSGMLAEKDRMLGAIGHDLRTPLASLRVRLESVEDETDRARMVDTVEEMNRTLDDTLSLARLGRPSEAATEVDAAALVDAVVEDFRDLGADVTFVETERLPLRL